MTREPWDMQEEEDDRAFAAFKLYRDTPPRERALAKVAKQIGVTQRTVERMSSKHHWVRRVEDWDRHEDELQREHRLSLILEMHDRHAELATMAQRMVAISMQRRLEELEARPDLRMGDGVLLAFMTQSAQMERLARGEPTEISKLTGTDYVEVTWGDEEMPDDDGDEWTVDDGEEDQGAPSEDASRPEEDPQQ